MQVRCSTTGTREQTVRVSHTVSHTGRSTTRVTGRVSWTHSQRYAVYVSSRYSTLKPVRVTGTCSGAYSTTVTLFAGSGNDGLPTSAAVRPAAAATTTAPAIVLRNRRQTMFGLLCSP